MNGVVLLDAGPLGIITNPRSTPETDRGRLWLEDLVRRGYDVVIPEIADYEVRRELIRSEKTNSLARLDALKGLLSYHPISTLVMLRAAQFWATARKAGRPSADDFSLDADVILAAQASTIAAGGRPVYVATTNVRHLARFADARFWTEIC